MDPRRAREARFTGHFDCPGESEHAPAASDRDRLRPAQLVEPSFLRSARTSPRRRESCGARPDKPAPAAAVSHRKLAVGGKSHAYTATAGTIDLKNDAGDAIGRMFSVAYVAGGGVRREDAAGDLLLQRRAGLLDALAAHGLVRTGAGRDDRRRRDAAAALRDRRQRRHAARQDRPRLRRRHGNRLLARPRQGGGEELLRHRRRHRRLRPVHRALVIGEQALELAQVPARRVLRHDARGRACSATSRTRGRRSTAR